MAMLGLTVWMEMAAKEQRRFGPVLSAEDNRVRMALNFEMKAKKKKRCPKSTWKGKVKDSWLKAHLKEEDASNRTNWRKCV